MKKTETATRTQIVKQVQDVTKLKLRIEYLRKNKLTMQQIDKMYSGQPFAILQYKKKKKILVKTLAKYSQA